jgi:hypothetical protein
MAGVVSKGSKLWMGDSLPLKLSDVISNLTSIGEAGSDVDELETTDLDSGRNKEFISNMVDGGSVSVAGNFVVGGTAYTKFKTAFDSGITTNFGISHPSVPESNMGFKGHIASLKVGERTPSGLLTYSATLRVTGPVGDYTIPVI